MMPRAFITGLTGATLTAEERSFLRDARPWGLILFKRNVETPAQVSALTLPFAMQSAQMLLSWLIRRGAVCSASGRRTGPSTRQLRPMAGFMIVIVKRV